MKHSPWEQALHNLLDIRLTYAFCLNTVIILSCRVASLQESISSQALDQRRIKLRIEHLEKENTDLRDSIGKLKSEKFNLEKINRELENQIAYDPVSLFRLNA